jgi:hypothetical protein
VGSDQVECDGSKLIFVLLVRSEDGASGHSLQGDKGEEKRGSSNVSFRF